MIIRVREVKLDIVIVERNVGRVVVVHCIVVVVTVVIAVAVVIVAESFSLRRPFLLLVLFLTKSLEGM